MVPEVEVAPCPECKGSCKINKKVWTQGPHVEGVHPAILARRPAYRTIAQFTCPSCKGSGKETKS